jgi:hypothetical protein
MKQVIITSEKHYSVKSGSGWKNTLLEKETFVKGLPSAEDKANMTTAIDSVAASFKSTDLRMVVDAGYQVNNFNIGVKYTAGVNSYYDAKSSPVKVQDPAKNSSVQVYLRYNLFGKKK